MQGLLIHERQRPLRNAQNSLDRLRQRGDRSLHGLEGDGAGLARDEKIDRPLLKSEHQRDEHPRSLFG